MRRPAFDPAHLKCGIVHLGIGAFHRAHQAVFTQDAIEKSGGDWGIIGASLQRPDVPDALAAQDCLYTVESLGAAASYRVMGVIRQALFAPRDRAALLAALACARHPCGDPDAFGKRLLPGRRRSAGFSHPDIIADLAAPDAPRSAIGWLALALDGAAQERRRTADHPVLRQSPVQWREAGRCGDRPSRTGCSRDWRGWIAANAAFPLTLVDCIVPASGCRTSRPRRRGAWAWPTQASVQREEFAQWVIQDRFAGPLPAWGAAGAEIVPDIAGYQRLKLHVLNTAHSALAYLGLPRGHVYVRQAIADPQLRGFLDAMMAEEIAPRPGASGCRRLLAHA